MKPITCPKQSIWYTMAHATKDWSADKNDAWIYGIILGWDESLPEIAERFGWDESAVRRIERLHKKFTELS